MPACMEVKGQLGTGFFPYTVWLLGIELGSLGLVACDFTPLICLSGLTFMVSVVSLVQFTDCGIGLKAETNHEGHFYGFRLLVLCSW